MDRIKAVLLIILMMGIPLAGVEFSHEKLQSYKIGDALKLKMQPDQAVQFALIFYKIGENKQFQVRKMDRDKDRAYHYQLESKYFTHRDLQYHFVVYRDGKYTRYPQNMEITATGEGKLLKIPRPEPKPIRLPVKFSGNYTGKWAVDSKSELTGSQKSSQSGNLTFQGNFSGKKYQMSFKSTANYLPDSTSQEGLHLSSVAVNLTSGNHRVQVGDVSFQAPQLMMSAYGKRGLYYNFKQGKINLELFTLSSQKLSGLGLPKSDGLVSGGMADYTLGPVKIISLFLAGRDDPSTGQNSSYYFNTIRAGSLMAFGLQGSFLKSALNIQGTYFLSNYSKDIEDIEKESDHAIDAQASFRHKGLSLSSNYKEIGGYYNSVGSSYLSNNQRSSRNSLRYSFMKSKAYFSASYKYLENNIDPEISSSPHSSTHNLAADLNFTVGKFKIGAGVQSNNQTTDVDESLGLPAEITSMQYTLTTGFNSTPFTLTLKGGKSLNRSTTDKDSLTFSASMRLQLGKVLTLSPNATYLEAEQNGETTTNITGYVSYRIVVVPKLFTISGTGSYYDSSSTRGINYESTTLAISSRLSLQLGFLWKKLSSSSVYVEGKYSENTYGGLKTTDYKIYGSVVLSVY